MKLRDYQRRAVDNVGRCLASDASTLLVMPTGTGKTVTFAHAIAEHSGTGRALVLAHREELIRQNAKAIERVLGEPCDIERADQHADLPGMHAKSRVVVASKDSLHAKRLAKFDPTEFGLIVTDEAHHSPASSYGRIYDHFAGVPHLGVTATPDRFDEEALGQVYASVAMTYEIADAIHDGWLVPVKARTVFVKDLNLSTVSTTAGDLNVGELAEQLEAERPMHEVAASVTKECGDRKAIVFTVSVRQAERLCEILNDYQPNCARWICGATPEDKRRADLAAHRAGEVQFMVNVGVLTEGYDDPGVSMIVMARPTKSRSLFAQCLGRGTRPLPGVVDQHDDACVRRKAIESSEKPDLLVLDFTGNCGRHKLASPADVLGGKYTQSQRDSAAEEAMSGEVDMFDALERARSREESSGSKQDILDYSKSRSRILTIAKYLMTEEDLFDGAFAPGRERAWLSGKAPTEAQVNALEKFGIERHDALRLSKSEASKIIGGSIIRIHSGLCTLKQARALGRFGIQNPEKMTFADANAKLGQLIARSRSRA